MSGEVKVEAVSSSSEEEVQATPTAPGAAPAAGDAQAKGPKQSRSEKKGRKAVQRLGLKPVPGVLRVRVKKGKSVLFVIHGPEVFKSPNNDTTYVIFGEAKMDQDLAGQALSENAGMFNNIAQGANDLDDDIPDLVPSNETPAAVPAGGPAVEANEQHISLVMEQTNCSRAVAIKALQETGDDVVNAILRAST